MELILWMSDISSFSNPPMDFDDFKVKLDNSNSWPSLYMFKFIVPAGHEKEVEYLFLPNHNVTHKNSKNGKYVSLTAEIMAGSSDDVIEIYKAATKIEGLIAL